MEDCPICHSEIKGKVYMTCSSKHAFCFECILKSIESSNELKNCALCRGGGDNKYILMDSNTDKEDPLNFYSITKFKKSMPIIQKILKTEVSQNTCIISDKLLLTYVKNKKQLEFSNILREKYTIDEIFPVFKWDSEREINGDIGDLLRNVTAEILIGSLSDNIGSPFQQYMRRQ